jgi:hypothetical protein
VRSTVYSTAIACLTFATFLISTTSHAQPVEPAADAKCNGPQIGVYYCFYPFFSTYTAVDEGYRFDDDLLLGEALVPYVLPRRVDAIVDRETLVRPRLSFVGEIFESASAL